MAGISEIRVWFEDLVGGVSPTHRPGQQFVLSRDSEPIGSGTVRVELQRQYEVEFRNKSRMDWLITGDVGWRTDMVLRIAYIGFQDARELRVRMEQDIEDIDRAVIKIGQTGLPTNLCDIDTADAGPDIVFLDAAENFAIVERIYSVVYTVSAG